MWPCRVPQWFSFGSTPGSENPHLAGRQLITSKALLVFLVLTSLALLPPNALGEATRIYEVVHSIRAISGAYDPVIVNATVIYNDTAPGSSLIVGILDADRSPQTITPGIASASPDACVNPPQLTALCQISLRASSGAEELNFKIGGILGGRQDVGTWDLNMTAALFNQNGTLIPRTVSTVPFAIQLVPVALQVVVPPNVAVSIDGYSQQPGPALVGVKLGDHNVTTPTIVQVDPETRMRFDHWSDGSTDANRTILVRRDTNLVATYITQYLLTITGQGTTTGAGWYDENSTATLSAPPTQPMPGLLGTLGGKLNFQGWDENGTLLTTSPTGTLAMNGPHLITIATQADYTLPTVALAAVAAIVALAYLFQRRRIAKTTRRRPQRTRKQNRKR
jgi:hypothetical protein